MSARITVHCRSCDEEFRIIPPTIAAQRNGPTFCLYCGAQDVFVSQDSERDFWEVMQESFGLPIPLLQLFYASWQQDSEGLTKFRMYMERQLQKALAKKEE